MSQSKLIQMRPKQVTEPRKVAASKQQYVPLKRAA